MNNLLLVILLGLSSCSLVGQDQRGGENEDPNFAQDNNFKINAVEARYHNELGILVFEITTKGDAGKTVPKAHGQLDGAPVLGYVIPTDLKSTDVGFAETEGIVALALTSHPDFDDTPLWDENADRDFANDGVIWHPHWVVLNQDDRVKGGLSVKQFSGDGEGLLPPTNPGMPMYMDSPGFPVTTNGNKIIVTVPAYRMSNRTEFHYDAASCYMQVN
ncbi:MAG: hypothetical protein AAFU03_11650, partial [Bacteroidota bacterium]